MADHALALGLKSRYSGRLPGFFQEVPRMEDEVHDLPSLREVGRALFDQDAAPLSS
jgi:hypothetical protein